MQIAESVESSSIEGEEGDNESFNFDKWVSDNELTAVKHLLIKHGMTTVHTLSLTSNQFTNFTSDIVLLTQFSQFISKTVKALQQIPSTPSPNHDSYIVVTEEEHSVMDGIKNNIKTLEALQIDLNYLKEKYRKSVKRINNTKLKQIENADTKISNVFNGINNALQIKKQILLKSLDNVKKNININRNQHDDNKENDIISNSMIRLKQEILYLSKQFEKCNEMIKSSNNESRRNRKTKILQIGEKTAQHFIKTKQKLNQNAEIVKNMINKNKNCVINIDFGLNNTAHNKLLKKISCIGIIINEEYDPAHTSNQKNSLIFANDDDDIASLKERVYKKQITSLKEALTTKNKQSVEIMNTLRNELQDKDAQIYSLNAKLKRIKEENKKSESSTKVQNELDEIEKALVFNVNSKYRWYLDDDEKSNILVGKVSDDCKSIIFIDGKAKHDILLKNISVNAPKTKNTAKYVEFMKIWVQNRLKRLEMHKDKWNIDLMGESFSIDDNILVHSGDNGWNTAFLCNIIKSGKHHWKFKIKEYHVGNINSLMFGIWDTKHDAESALNTYIATKAHRAYVYNFGCGRLNVHDKDNMWTPIDSYGVRCKVGSIISVYLDMNKLELSFGINNKHYGKAFRVKKTHYCAAVSTFYSNTSIELVIYDKM